MVEEIAVVGDADHRSGILLQVLLQPVDRLRVKVVGRLVEQQHVGLLQQQATESHPSAFTSRKGINDLIFGRTTQGVHRTFQAAVEVPGVGCVDLVLQLRLAVDQSVHLVGSLQHLGIAETLVHLLKLLE